MPCAFSINDCETGGVDDRINPILSAAIVLADESFNEIEGFASKILPPKNTWLEVPIPEHQTPQMEFGRRTIEYYLNMASGDKAKDLPMGAFLITAGAAEVNGFVGTAAGLSGWDFEPMANWLANSVPLELAEEIFTRFLAKHCVTPPIGVAHNAVFDVKYFKRYLPETFSRFAVVDEMTRKANSDFSSGWYCTCSMLKKYNKKSPNPAPNAKLGSLAMCAGYDLENAHEALADARACLAGLRWLKTGSTVVC